MRNTFACLVGLNSVVLAAVGWSATGVQESAIDIDSYWEYSDPAASEARFRAALDSATGDGRLEILTQIARSFSLRGRFDEAHKLLDEIEPQLRDAGHRPRVRTLLERGRTFNSAGDKGKAREQFLKAWNDAGAARLEGLAADAAHMVAITYSGTLDAIEWNRRGLAAARASNDPKARGLVPAMLNNAAWDLHDMGRYAEALPLFEEALKEWNARGNPKQIRIAKWSVARCLRSLGRFQEALEALQVLEKEYASEGEVDASVLEEIAANRAALGTKP
ncbi:MAG: tetratricopeptide repeat protein [Burkholderiales bacterium]|nr:tetratricopeptide repeat protein [Burkholderiales bacterium]